jgi:hypothetical protein
MAFSCLMIVDSCCAAAPVGKNGAERSILRFTLKTENLRFFENTFRITKRIKIFFNQGNTIFAIFPDEVEKGFQL